MIVSSGTVGTTLTTSDVRTLLTKAFSQTSLAGKRILVLIPDGTRSGPTDLFFRLFHELLGDRVTALDYLIALGTHQPMSEAEIHRHIGVSADEMETTYAGVRVFNHRWDDPDTFRTLGAIPAGDIEDLSQGRLSVDVPIRINRMIFEYDQVIICGPVFPHEVVGFSGGNKYFFPGISGQEIIDATHWLGALITSYEIIGTKQTPVRAIIDRASGMIDVPALACCYVTQDQELAGLYVGTPTEAWSHAADMSSKVHVTYVDRKYDTVLSVMPAMYDDLWTAAKGMYKLEPIVADGGEIIIYAPHIDEFSYTHGRHIEEIGYHVRDYFVSQWDRFKEYPWGVLAHSTHLRGIGTYVDDVEVPRIRVTLATGILRERCEAVNLGYRSPDDIDPQDFVGREAEGLLCVLKAGEQLYRLSASA